MVHIHITAKPSTRYPGKNDMLWPYTSAWLANELQDLTEPHDVLVTVRGGGLDRFAVPPAWKWLHLMGEPYSHESDLRRAVQCQGLDGDHVLLQLTQPLRRQGLLSDAVKALRDNPAATVMSESGGEMDGALYAWRGDPACVFERRNPYYVHNIESKVDIDTPADVPENLPALWAEVLLSTHSTSNQ